MKSILPFILIAFMSSLLLTVNGQQSITPIHQQAYTTDDTFFYDNGGPIGDVANQYAVSSVQSNHGYIKIFFEYIDIPDGATLRVYEGSDTTSKNLLGYYDGVKKPWTYIGTEFTFVYTPGYSNESKRGWKGRVTSSNNINVPKSDSPESDCINAIPLCSNSTVNTSANQYDDTGLVDDDSGGCYDGTGNGGSVWYTFTPQATGLLDFAINPLGSTDYDFVLWDITSGCDNRVELSCNFSATTGNTGLNSTATGNSKGSGGGKWNARVNVNVTSTYALVINYYSGNNAGFNLIFQNDPTSVAVIDNTPPTIVNAYTLNCASASIFTVDFSEYMDCSTLDNSDFTIPGYTVVISNSFCIGGKTLQVELTVSPAMPPGSYTLSANNATDFCGNLINDTYNIVTTTVPTANAGPDQTTCSTAGIFGSTNYQSTTLNGSGGVSYIWNTGQTGSSISVTPTTTTTYTLTSLNGSCAVTDDVIVSVSPSPVPNLGPDQVICAGFTANMATGATGTSYVWETTTTTGFFGAPTGWSTIAGATTNSYSDSPGVDTYYQVTVTDALGCTGSNYLEVTIGAGTFGITGPAYICDGAPVNLSLPAGMTDYTWDIGGTPIGTANTALVDNPSATTTYNVTSTTAGCAGTASIIVNVHPAMILAVSANPSSYCPGVPVNLTGTGPANTSDTLTEDFESPTTYTLVNGGNNNWYQGTATSASGTSGLYVGTSSANNNYVVQSGGFFPSAIATTNFAYKDYTITSTCLANIAFDWRCLGVATEAEFRVWVVPTTYVPVAGTQITASGTEVLIGGPYSGSSAYQNVSLDLSSFANLSVRVVFEWNSTGASLFGGAAANPPAAAIDNIVFTESDTYSYAWTSNTGFSASTILAIDNAISADTYTLVVTRCDGCPVAQSLTLSACTTLPIELYSFDGNNKGRHNNLYWVTVSEINNDYFNLERSIDAVNWSFVAQVQGAGTSQTSLYYEFKDYNFKPNEVNYYRLSQYDFDGEFVEMDRIVSIDNSLGDRKVIRRTNLLGQDVSKYQKGLLLFIYDDGTIEKHFVQ